MRRNLFNFLSKTLLAVSGLTCSLALAHGSGKMGVATKIVTVKTSDYRSEVVRLMSEGYDIAGVNLDEGSIDVVVSDLEYSALSATKGLNILKSKTIDTKAGVDEGYTTYTELTAILKDIANKNPDIVHLESFGKSLEGRDLWAVKISDNASQAETDEPVVFFNAMHHAREVMTTEVALDAINFLIKGYTTGNGRVKNWVDKNEIWIVPMVNPDGNNKVWTSDNMWRKNARGSYGVDINRNYPYKWGACNGSSGSQSAQDYHGPSAASEPETQAMMNFVGRIRPVMSISYHSYSELVIYPLSCEGEHAADRETVESIGKQLAGRLPKDSGGGTYKPGTAWEILYPVDGGDIDYFYSEYDVLPYVIEVNSDGQGFQPSFAKWRQKTVEKMRAGWGFFLDRVGQSGLRGSVYDAVGKPVTSGEVTIEPVTPPSFVSSAVALKTYKIKPDGKFHVILPPGMYKVKLHSGERSVDSDVIVGAQRADVDFTL